MTARHLTRRGGVFVEAGANDGYAQSNTYYFERMRGWSGVLIEPVPELAHHCPFRAGREYRALPNTSNRRRLTRRFRYSRPTAAVMLRVYSRPSLTRRSSRSSPSVQEG